MSQPSSLSPLSPSGHIAQPPQREESRKRKSTGSSEDTKATKIFRKIANQENVPPSPVPKGLQEKSIPVTSTLQHTEQALISKLESRQAKNPQILKAQASPLTVPRDIVGLVLSYLSYGDIANISLVDKNHAQNVRSVLTLKPGAIDKILRHYEYDVEKIPPRLYKALKNRSDEVKTLILAPLLDAEKIGRIAKLFPHVHTLCLKGATDQAIKTLALFPNLTTLNLCGCNNLTDAIGPHLATLTHLATLDLSFCGGLTGAFVPYLAMLTQLTTLKLDVYNSLARAIIPQLATLTNLKCSFYKLSGS